MLELVTYGLDDGRVPVAEHVDAEAPQTVDVLLAVDVAVHVTTVGPLDCRVVGRETDLRYSRMPGLT